MLGEIEKAAFEADGAEKAAKEKRATLEVMRTKFWKVVGKPPGAVSSGFSFPNLLAGNDVQSAIKGTLLFGGAIAVGFALLMWAAPVAIALGMGFLIWKAWSEGRK